MPAGEPLSHCRDLKRGDVVMVHHNFIPRGTKTPRTWRFFGVVFRSGNAVAHLRRLNPGEDRDPNYTLVLDSPRVTAYKLEPDEWPDGVHQTRMQLILTREIDLD